MKRKYIIAICLSLPLLAALPSCSSDDDASSKAGSELLNAEREVDFAATETSWQVKVVADCPWEVTAVDNSGWQDLSISPRSGEGNGILVISTEQNHTSQDRTAVITLTTKGGLQQNVTIHQTRSSADLQISQNTFNFNDAASTQTLKVTCNTNWSIVGMTGNDWLELGQTSGNGNAEIPITVKENFDDGERTVVLTVSAGNLGDNQFDCRITQSGKELITLKLSATELPAFAYTGGTQKVNVTCNGVWYATVPSSIGWLHISPSSGIGNGVISISCDAYTGTQERLSVVTVSAGTKNPQHGSIVITQSN